jgi:hypothetical protein
MSKKAKKSEEKENLEQKAIYLLVNAGWSYHHSRSAQVDKVWEQLKVLNPDQLGKARIEYCADERTGNRYAEANCRLGCCKKIGSSGNWAKHNRQQIWLVWS